MGNPMKQAVRTRGFQVCRGALLGLLTLCAGCSDNFNPSVVVSPSIPINEPPQIDVTEPDEDRAISKGDSFLVRWTDRDSDDNALISIDLLQTNGAVVFPLAANLRENDSSGADLFVVNTTNVVSGEYFVRMTISDGVNNAVTAFADNEITGNRVVVTITSEGLGQSNKPPRIALVDPQVNVGVSQSDMLTVSIRPTTPPVPVNDPGPGGHYDQDGDDIDVTILLDLDENPNNDNFEDEDDPGIIILDRAFIAGGRFDQVDFDIEIDVSMIPVRADGEPYFVRASASDGLNTAHTYAAGTVHVLELVQGSASTSAKVTDLAMVGRRFAGAVWQGFNPLANLGSKMATAMDIDNDGADDFVVVAQYGNPRNRGNIGEAYLVFGAPQRRFGGRININSVSTDIVPTAFGRVRGSVLHPHVDRLDNFGALDPGDDTRIGFVDLTEPYTMGITDVVAVPDLGGTVAGTGCTSPELLFGIPHCEYLGTTQDNDPGNDPPDGGIAPYCYLDPLPNNYASDITDDDPSSGVRYVEGTPDSNGWAIEEKMGTAAMMYGENFVVAAGVGANPCAAMQGPPTEVFGLTACGSRFPGVRFNVAIYDNFGANSPGAPFQIDPLNSHFGYSVGVLDDVDLNGLSEIVVSSPRNELEVLELQADPGEVHPHLASRLSRGNVTIYLGQDFYAMNPRIDPVNVNVPFIASPQRVGQNCTASPFRVLETELHAGGAGAKTVINGRGLVGTPPGWFRITGEKASDKLGGATSAGDFNLDGPADILCGAPFADPLLDTDANGFPDTEVVDAGAAYVVYSRLPFGNANLADANNISDVPPNVGGLQTRPPMLRIFGESTLDHLGLRQVSGADMNADGLDDIIIASKDYNGQGRVDNGFVGVVFGGQRIDGDRVVSDIASPLLSGCRFYGNSDGDLAGADVAGAGDFNGDGMGDLLIAAPGERRSLAGEDKPRRGAVYLIFGGRQLIDRVFTLNQVGTAALPGVVFIGPYQEDTVDAYELDQPVFVRDTGCDPYDSTGRLVDTECLCDPEVEENCGFWLRPEDDPDAPGSVALVRVADAAPSRVAFVGDTNGDGFDDIMIGNPTADFLDPTNSAISRRRDAGEAYLIYGNNFGENTLNGN